MSSFSPRKLGTAEFPSLLAEIPQPPSELWAVGNLPPPDLTLLAVVGSRKYTTYGKQVIEHLISGLADYPIGIVSGLALGVDALAHDAALRHGLYTLAVPGSGLDESVLYPASNRNLARTIVDAGGGLLSELSPLTKAAKWTFPQRNRIMAGMCPATLLIEAGAKSGTLITARLCVDYNRELLVVPGSIFASNSAGTHQFLKLGATPVTIAEDILMALGIDIHMESAPKTLPLLSPLEARVLDLLHEPTDRDTLIRKLELPISEAVVVLMQMEMMGYITIEGNTYHGRF
ncbi:DNA-processing protein DprA [Patescibacteria group bacterium]|nr:DNA-processing protein DprA [Patescibacteria group bacterium]